MTLMKRPFTPALRRFLCLAWLLAAAALAQAQGLPSWNDGAAKQAILGFVADVTTPGSPNFVPPAERIAVFDNEGTLWIEPPMYVSRVGRLDKALDEARSRGWPWST